MEWVGLVLVVSLLLLGLVAAGARVPGIALTQAVASRILCAAALAESCGDEPRLIAAYGGEVGEMVRRHMPSIVFEPGSKALPVDFRRCRESACADGPSRGSVLRSDAGHPVTAFVHVIDCRSDAVEATEDAGADCSGARAGGLYVQYWFYYPDSATLRGVPIAGRVGYHRDDWESLQVRIGSDGAVAHRASSHHGYNYASGLENAGSDAGVAPVRELAEAVGARPENGWGAASPLLLVSGGSHAGNVSGFPRISRLTPGHRVHLIPFEPIVEAGGLARFAVTPPWEKLVWRDPETHSTE